MGALSHGGEGVIAGVVIRPLRIIADGRGAVLHMLRADWPEFHRFGEIYFSEVAPGAVKAWKRHFRMTQHFAVPVGRIRLVIHDAREGSPTRGQTQVLELGRPDAYVLAVIPPMLWYGFSAIGDRPALLANCADLPHDPAESEQLDPADAEASIPYLWSNESISPSKDL